MAWNVVTMAAHPAVLAGDGLAGRPDMYARVSASTASEM